MPIKIIDTTLRDGEQRPGLALSADEKLKVAALLDEMGIYQIEAGIPAMGGDEKYSVQKIAALKRKGLVSAWNRMNIGDIKHSLDCDVDIIHISVPVSDIQIYKKLNVDRKRVMSNLIQTLDFASQRHNNITVGFEDASRADEQFLMKVSEIAKKYNVLRVRYADTVGVLYSRTAAQGIKFLSEHWGSEIEIHAHNDLGMAVGNTIAACIAGSNYVNTTIGGVGERAGNCDFKGFVKAASRCIKDFEYYLYEASLRKTKEVMKLLQYCEGENYDIRSNVF